jgi:hypothetical protein
MELWQLYLSQPPSAESLWAVRNATVHMNSEKLAPGWEWNFKHPPEEKETLGICSSAQPFHFWLHGGGEEQHYGHCSQKEK